MQHRIGSKIRPTKPIPLRLDLPTISRLDRAARRMASNRSGVIRLGILQLLPDIEAGTITLRTDANGGRAA